MLLHRPALNSLGTSTYFAYQARLLHIRKRQKICYSAGYPVLQTERRGGSSLFQNWNFWRAL